MADIGFNQDIGWAGGVGNTSTFTTGTLTATTVNVGHTINTGSLPGNTPGTGAGTGPTITVLGHDGAGSVSVLTGTTPAGSNANIVTINFATSYPTIPYTGLTAANANAAALGGTTGVFVTATTAGFTIVSGSAALSTPVTYLWNYQVEA